MKKVYTFVLLLLLAFALTACGSGSTPDTSALDTQVANLQKQLADANAALASAQSGSSEQAAVVTANTLQLVRDRGSVKCGGNQAVPGFGYLNPATNNFEGFDIDFCKAVAAAVFGDATKHEIRPSTAGERFPILQTGEVDVLIRNTTWTFSRDTSLGFEFAPVTFYDGQGMMVRRADGINSLKDMAGATVCVQSGTTTERNLSDSFRSMGIPFEPLVFDDADKTREAYDAGQCDGFTTDKSGLVSQQILLANPTDHVVLEDTMSKEPLGPLVRHGDNNWGDIVRWTVFCTFQAEELGVSMMNADEMLSSEEPAIQNLLGATGDLGQMMGLNNDFCYQVVKQVGNYAEIYNRNLGPGTPFNLPRGQNALWTDGGLLYSMPFR